jgi:hypothetical protein
VNDTDESTEFHHDFLDFAKHASTASSWLTWSFFNQLRQSLRLAGQTLVFIKQKYHVCDGLRCASDPDQLPSY